MALKILSKNQKLFSNHILKNFLDYELIFVSNVRHISDTPQKTQMSTSYGKPKDQFINITKWPKNMILRHCSPTNSASLMDDMFESMPMATVGRPLTLIFAWMFAKDKHLEKFRHMWFKRGFDVLTVRTSLLDALFPSIGSQIVAQNLVKALSELSSQYNEIVVHAFSVGGYQFGETLVRMRAEDQDLNLMNSIKGVVLDSMVSHREVAPGLSRAIILNPIIQPTIEKSIHVFLKLFKSISVKNYVEAEEIFFNPLVRYPGLLLYSRDDVVSTSNESLAQSWTKIGNNMRTKCWDHSTHVLHYRDHQNEYEEELDTFLKSLDLRNIRL